MTSDTAPSGVCSADSVYSPTYAAWKAFDQNGSTFWNSAAHAQPWWLQYQFGFTTKIVKYSIVGYTSYSPIDFKLQGSNNGTAWDDLNAQTGQSMTGGTEYTYAVNSDVAYSYFRLYITSSQNAIYGVVPELKLYSLTPPP